MGILTIVTTLLVDLYPAKSSGARSASNLARCSLVALFTDVLSPVHQILGIGGSMTLLAGVCVLSNVSLLYPIMYAMKNAQKRTS